MRRELKSLSIVGIAALVSMLNSGCANWDRPHLTHVKSPQMGKPAIPVAPGSDPLTAVTLAPVCHRGKMWLPAGTLLQYSYPTPYPYSPWRPVYRMKLPGRSTWWPCTAVMSKSGMAYFSYFVLPTRTLSVFQQSCSRKAGGCCPYDPTSNAGSPNKNPLPPHR